ncbi:DUF4347 domain-containing protein [Azospirillum sp. TSH58]|uniref:DUF4347 domain-containing protein n=2 Tax=Azospirillum sp. TSH58 TaxID=664962 RepID=UPI0013A56CD9|nr:DUF4347 domain-containing protein [Azospirillum sp. TSH58]
MALEPRFMFDAAGAVTAAEVHQQPDQPAPGDKGAAKAADADKLADWAIKESTVPAAASSPAASAPALTEPAAVTARLAGLQGAARSVVFVDTSVSDYQTLLKDIAPDAKVVLLDSQQEALGQMAKALSGMSGLDSVQVVSHGNEGHLYIAGRAYWADGLANRAQDLQAIGAALKPGGDILFYACNVGAGQAGQEFVQTIHRLTGADVAVSSDETGNAAGQNWTLEVQSGAIEAAIPFARASMETFSGRLGTVVVTSASGTAAGSLNDAIKNATQSTIIEFSSTLTSSTISLGVTSSPLTAAAQDITINGDVNGDGIADITISGAGTGSVPASTDYRGITFNASAKTLTVKNLTFERFYVATGAGGLLALTNGSIEVDGVTFANNANTIIYTGTNAANVTVRNSVFRENVGMVAGTAAHAVIKSQASVATTIENSVFVDNSFVMSPDGNSATYPGGIIVVQSSASAFTANIRNVTIANNSFIANNAAAAAINTAAIGTVYNGSTGTATVNVYNTIIAGNSGSLGGTSFADPNAIIYNSGKITLNTGSNYQGAITGNAIFVDSTNATKSLRDYRPASTATTFINAGDSSNANRYGGSYDIRGIDRIRDGVLDLGAYEVHWNAGDPSVDLNGAGAGTGESVSTSTPASGVLIAPNAVVTQTDSDTRLLGATITLSGTSDGAAEVLSMLTASVATAKTYGISVTGNDTGTITLRGAASVAGYQAVLQLIQYKNTAGSATAGTRTATVTVNDGETTSTARTSQITLGGSSPSNGAPVNSVVPTVGGTATVGNALTGGTGTWSDPDGDSLSYSYQWYRADDTNGTNAASIAGATSASYTLTTSDAHKYLRVAVIANDGNSNTTTAYSTYTAITNSAPVNSAAPSVSGTATVGNALSTSNGTWTDADGDSRTYSYQWYRADDSNGTNATSISGATSSSYTLAAGDLNKYLRVEVTANDGRGGTQAATSAYSSQVAAAGNGAPVNSVVPTVGGTATVGNALTGGTGTWSDPDGDSLSYSYQWYRADDTNGTNAASIAGATSASYTLTTSDAHKYLRVAVIANDGNSNTTTAYSTYTAITNSAPVNSAAPSVSGTATVGNALSTTNGTWTDADGDGRTYSYQWYRADDSNGTNATSISGATSSSYTLAAGDLNKYLRVEVTANDGRGGTQAATSAYSSQVAAAGNGAPVNSVVPTVGGTATVGNALTGGTGTWSDPDGDSLSYSYQWYRADDTNGTNAASIAGATSASYTLTTSDAHKYLRVAVIANDGNSNTTTAYSTYTAITNSAPVNSAVPSVSGTATVGNALSTSNGTWTDADGDSRTYSYQWYRADDTTGTNATSISGATSSSYTLTTSDAHKYLRVVVTANDGKGGTQTATSTYTAITNSAPVNSAVPSVSGTATVGNALSTTNGTWTDADGDGRTYSYQWYRADDTTGTNGASISGATSSSYTLTTSDAHKYLRVVVTANDGKGGTQTATSTYTAITNSAPVNSAAPTVSGTATVGNALSTTNGTWTDADGDGQTYSYQWYRADDTAGTNGASISGATSSSYTLTTSDAHKYLRVVVTANDGKGGTQTATSTYTAITNSAPVNSAVPSVSGTATVGNALSTTNGTWTDADGDGRTYSYQWYRADDTTGTNGASISGATSSSYTLTTSDAHKCLRVVVTANDGKGGTQTATSTYTAITNSAPVNSAAPSVTGTATVGSALSTTNGTWTDADGDGRTYSYQWYRADDTTGTNGASISGATSSSYTLTTSDAHKYLRVVVTANDGKGGTQTATSTYTAITNSAPVNSAVPSVSGTATVGNALSTTNGTWTDADGDGRTYSYQWYRADDTTGTNGASISGATSSSYTLTTSDAHKYLRVVVTANDGKGGTQTATSTYTAITNSAPVNSAAPSVTGTATVGSALSTTNGTWTDADGDGRTYSYQWYRADDTTGTNGASISGATSSSYTLTTSDAHKYLRVVVTANDGKGGTQTATSTYTAITNSAPVNSAAPSVSGTATVGNALSTTNGTWTDADGDGRTYSYQWYRADDTTGTNGASISGATSSSYTLTTSDAHKYLRVVVTANDGKGGTQTATSTYTAITNSAPVNSAAPTVSGTATVGNALSTTNGTWTDADGDGQTYSYQWYRADDTAGTNGASISGATSSSYTLTTSDAHKYLRVVVTANDGKGGTQTATSTYTAITNSAPVNSAVPSVSGTATVGNALSTTNGTWTDADGDGRTYSYQWYRADDTTGTNGASISGATSSSYTLTTSDAHKYLRVVVTANDGKGGTQTATSTYTAITNSAPVNSAAPSVTGTATVGSALSTTNGTWTDADGDGRTYSYQWYRADDTTGTNGASISGATSSSYTLTTSDAHKYLRVVVTANDGKGGTQTATSTYTAITNSAPVNSAVPSVSGTATVGNALSTTNGTWTDADGDGRTYSYQWYRADDTTGTNGASISGATSSSYTLTTSDAHKYLRVVVTANDGKGGTQTATSTYTAITNSAPVNSAAPSVTGTATVGSALSTTNGTWTDADGDGRTYSYQWYRADDTTGTNGASISGATSSSYTLTTSDAHKYLRVVVTANDGKGGTQTATSTYTAITNSAPVNSAAPSVSGTATVGNALSTTNGTWTDADGDGQTYSYQWYRADDTAGTNGASISGATSSSYTLTTSDAHKYLRVVVTANDGKGGTQTATSTYTAITNSAPVNSAVPSVSGTATVGNALSTTNGTWTDADGDGRTYSYQWYRADDTTGTNGASISGATSSSYTLTTSDAHKYLRVVVTANDGKGGTQTATSTYTAITNSAPVNSAAPSVSGTATVGNALSTTNGTWTDADGDGRTYSYQWYRADDTTGTNGASISGATSSSYTLTTSDAHKYLRVVVTANDGKGGTQTATSTYTAITNSAPVNSAVPSVSGTATVGNALSTTNGTWTDADGDGRTYSYQWYRADDTTGTNGASISGATSSSYTLTTSDAHKYLRVVVTANDGKGGTQTATSTYTAITNSAPVNSAVPSVSGTATVGNALSTTNGTWTDADGDGRTYSYQWYRADDSTGTNGASISGATSSSYTLTTSDAHKYLRVVVTANDGKGGTQTATSTYTAITNSAPVNSAAPSVSGTATVGNALSTTNGTWTDADGDGRTYSYQWYRADDSNGTNGASISGATSSSYTLTTSDAHKYLRVVVTANDGKGGTQTATSTYTAITNSAPVNSAAPSVTGTATVGSALSTTNGTWTDADGDGRTYSYQWYRADDTTGTNGASISGATSSSYTLTTSDAHKYLRVVVTANDGKGGTQTATSTYTAITNSAPVNSAAPSVTGTATVGNALSTTNGTWTDADGDGRTYSYQWYRADDTTGTNGASISGATSSSYTLTTSDAHKYLRVVVTANDGKGGTQTATSTYTAITNSAPVNSAVPSVSGTATVGNALSTTNGTWTDADGDGRTYSYQWYRADDTTGTNGASISGATSSSYTLTTSDAHKYLRVVVTANDGKGGTQTATSTYTAITNSAPVNSAVPSVSGTATVGNALSTTNGTWTDADGDGRTYSYQWYRADDTTGTNGASISGATSSSYTLTTSDAHKYLRVVVTANDGKGGTQTATSIYTAVINSAPVLSTDARSLTAIQEDATGNNGDTVAAILASAGTATDVDGNTLGIAITATDTSNGVWQYKTGAGTWTTITGVSGASALLLASTDRVRFVPNADYNGSVANGITFKAWDQTAGTAGTTVGNDTTANGGLGAGGQFSAASVTAGIDVTAVNDAPVLTDTVLTLPSVAQAAGAPNGAVGVAVSSLVALGANVSDVDSGAVTGIALVGLDNSEGGTWYYSTDGGTSWTAVGTVNDSGNALLLRTTDRLYYQPTGANAGILSAAITFRAWDQTSGTAGTKVATAGGGGTSAFSAATDTASLSITPAILGSAVTLAPASDTGNSNTDNITKASSVTFNGSGANANASTTVRLYANGSLVATTTADASGAYSFTGVDVSGLSGAVDFTVRQVIAGMESADSAVRTVTFDRTAPTVAITTVSGDNVLNASESAVAQTVSGTTTGVEDGQTVTVTLNGKTYTTTVTNNAWSLSIPSADLQALPDGGTYAITADLTDVAGNAAVQATRSVSVDRTPPTLAIATVAGDNVLNAADSAVGQTVAGVTNGVEYGRTVTVTLNGKSYTTTVTNNRWSLTVPSSDLLALTDGANYTVTASLTDAAGNPTQATRSVAVDRTPPSVVSVTPPPARTYLPGETVSFFVQLSEASIISGGNPVLELAVGSEIRNATYNAAGSTGTLLRFDYVVPVGDRAPQGIAVLGLALNGSIVTDAAQGPLVTTLKGVGDTSQVRIDTPIPAKPVGTALSGLSDSGVSATDRLTNVTRPTLSGTAEANATVTVLVDGKAVGTAVADENGFWVHRLQTALTDGTHSITTTATNRFGIVSDPSDALTVVIDTAVPVAPAPSVTSATVAGATAGERISGIATPSLAGTTEAGSTVNVLVDGKAVGTALADANGAWTFQFTAALADGTHSLQVQATDKAGNVSSLSAVTTLTIDTTPPVAPTVALNTTVGSTPVVQGTAEANSLVTVTINGQAVGTARASATGVWQLALASDLSVGSYVISAKASDAVGNTGNAGTTTYSVAPPPPPPVVVVAASTGNTTTAASPSNSAVATSAGTTQTTGPTLGTAPTLPSLQTSSDAGRVITSSSIGSGSGSGNGNSSTDAGRSITIGNIGNSTSSDAGRSITISAMGGAPSGGGTANSSNGVLGGGTGGSSGSGLSGVVSGGSGLGSGGLGGGVGGGVGGGSGLGGSALGGTASGGIGAGAGAGFGGAPAGGGPGAGLGSGGPATGGPAAGGPATGTGTGNGGLNGGVGGPGGAAGSATGGTPGGSAAPGGPGTATGGPGGAPGNRPGGQPGPGSTIESAPANRPAAPGGPQGRPQGQGQGQPPAGDAPPAGGDPAAAPAAPDGPGQAPGPRADLDGTLPARPAFSRQVAQVHGAADAQSAALLAALISHAPPGSRAA